MAYFPMSEPRDVPPEGPLSNEAREKQDLDFKSVADSATPWEHAKDIASFANSLGGTILVGASNLDAVTLHGLQGQTPRQVMDIYENAAMHCSPTVPIDLVPILMPSGAVIVAVNVAPYPDAVVAAPAAVKSRQPDGGKPRHERVQNSWRFPIRRASQTHYLKPEELPLYMNPQARRAYIRLSAIPPHREGFSGRRVRVFFRAPSNHAGVTVQGERDLQLKEVSLEKNAITLRYWGKLNANGQELSSNSVRVPLMDIEDVWEADDQTWAVRLRGCVECTEEVEMPYNRPHWKLSYCLLQ
jgi:hypothetical protein